MILVDSSIWIDYIQDNSRDNAIALDELLEWEKHRITVHPVIVQEVLQGIKNETCYQNAEEMLFSIDCIKNTFLPTYVKAASLYRQCRKKGITISSTIDVFLATIAIEGSYQLWSLDRDFQQIARYFPLQLYRPE